MAKKGSVSLRPLDDRIVVKRLSAEEKTAGGIILPDAAKEKPLEAKVVALGTGKKDESGRTVPRNLRHFPVRGADGKPDLPHLRNALSRIPQSRVPGLTDDEALVAALEWDARRQAPDPARLAAVASPAGAFAYNNAMVQIKKTDLVHRPGWDDLAVARSAVFRRDM